VVTLAASATRGDGLDALLAALDRRAAWLGEHGRLAMARQAQAEAWLREAVGDRFGRDGLARAAAQSQNFRLAAGQSPFSRLAELAESLRR
jgi:LAO/AO transport system kinase